MTCIVGLTYENATGKQVLLGGDSAGVGAGYQMQIRNDEKVFWRGPFLMGFTDSFRMGQLLRYRLNEPHHPEGMADVEFMTTIFIDAVRDCFKMGGYSRKTNEAESGGEFLVAYRNRLYFVDSDYQLGERADGYDAVGCGAQIALGSLFSTAIDDPQARVLTALEAAERYSAGVRGPFNLLSTETSTRG